MQKCMIQKHGSYLRYRSWCTKQLHHKKKKIKCCEELAGSYKKKAVLLGKQNFFQGFPAVGWQVGVKKHGFWTKISGYALGASAKQLRKATTSFIMSVHSSIRMGQRHSERMGIHEVSRLRFLLTFIDICRILFNPYVTNVIYIYIYIYGAPILDVSRSHTTTQHSR